MSALMRALRAIYFAPTDVATAEAMIDATPNASRSSLLPGHRSSTIAVVNLPPTWRRPWPRRLVLRREIESSLESEDLARRGYWSVPEVRHQSHHWR